MLNTATDYKLLYERGLAEGQLLKDLVNEKDNQIASLNFELDKFRKFLYGQKGEKFPSHYGDVSQINLFELGTTQEQQEDFSKEMVPVKAYREESA